MTTAHDILDAAAEHMRDRAMHYDKPEGERSMAATVAAFAAVTGIEMTEERGWLFLALLKAVRSQQGQYRADNFEDLAAYASLMGEAASKANSVRSCPKCASEFCPGARGVTYACYGEQFDHPMVRP